MIDRRKVLAGLAGLGASTALPAWAQAIRSQSDPYAQVDPYADPRNGFSGANDAEFNRSNRPVDRNDGERRIIANSLTDRDGFEISLGQAEYASALTSPESGGILRNAAAQGAFQAMCMQMAAVSERPELPWEFTLTADTSINGFALPGGKIGINVGVVIVANTPGELAAIVAHEIGHVDNRHGLNRREITALMELRENERASRAAPHLRELVVTGYRRENERQADRHIPFIFAQLGYDGAAAIVMYEKMIKMYGDAPKTCLHDVHPIMRERIQEIMAEPTFQPKGKPGFMPAGWKELKAAFPTPPEWRTT